MNSPTVLKAPFPWFGGKSRAAAAVWQRFGDCANYVEPFAGSLAVLLARPGTPRVETVNDVDAFISNFWRAITADPDAVAAAADWPVNETDLHARHLWLAPQRRALAHRLYNDPHTYDAQIAGWWVWGISQWIGSGWCPDMSQNKDSLATAALDRSTVTDACVVPSKRPAHGGADHALPGVHCWNQRPILTPDGNHGIHVREKRPHLGGESGVGKGVHSKIPNVDSKGGKGVHSNAVPSKRPVVTGDSLGRGVMGIPNQTPNLSAGHIEVGVCRQSESLRAWMRALQARLRRVRVCCGDWRRILTPAVLGCRSGSTAVFLDPPYSPDERDLSCYSMDDTPGSAAPQSGTLAQQVRKWAIAHGNDPALRIALCGYDTEHAEHMPEGWETYRWLAKGGYARTARAKANCGRETIWFSPACIHQPDLFSGAAS